MRLLTYLRVHHAATATARDTGELTFPFARGFSYLLIPPPPDADSRRARAHGRASFSKWTELAAARSSEIARERQRENERGEEKRHSRK